MMAGRRKLNMKTLKYITTTLLLGPLNIVLWVHEASISIFKIVRWRKKAKLSDKELLSDRRLKSDLRNYVKLENRAATIRKNLAHDTQFEARQAIEWLFWLAATPFLVATFFTWNYLT